MREVNIYSLPLIFGSATGAIETSWTISTGRTRHEGVVEWGLSSFSDCIETINYVAEDELTQCGPDDFFEEYYGCYQIDDVSGSEIQCINVHIFAHGHSDPEPPYLQSEFM